MRRSPLCSGFVTALAAFATVNATLLVAAPAGTKALSPAAFQDTLAAEEGRPGSWWMAKDYTERDTAPDIVIFGSSQLGGLQAADAQILGRQIDFVDYHRCAAVEGRIEHAAGVHIQAFTCALPGAMISDHYLTARALFDAGRPPAVAVLTISPRDFIDNTLPSPGATEPFRFFSRFVNVDEFVLEAFGDPLSLLGWLIEHRLPLRQVLNREEAGGDRDKTATVADTASAVRGMFNADLIRPGQCVIAPDMRRQFVDNSKEYARRYNARSSRSYEQQLAFLQRFQNEMQRRGVRVLIVGMPLMAANRDLLPPAFWSDYRNRIARICAGSGTSWLDLSDSDEFVMDDFIDHVHLNASGGMKLAAKISTAIAADSAAVTALRSSSGALATSPESITQ